MGSRLIRIATTESASRFHHYEPVVRSEGFEWLGQIRSPLTPEVLNSVDAMVFSDEFWQPTRLAIAACRMAGVATFHILDGIVEWRNLFENPRSLSPEQGAPLFQPLMCDLTFCVGSVQESVLKWLGNRNVIGTGLPRLDSVPVGDCRTEKTESPVRLLVATANTPWFDAHQEQVFLREFGALVNLLAGETSRAGGDLRIAWRVSRIAADQLSIENNSAGTLQQALEQCDAFITTPSTAAVEAMLLGVPTLIFDPYCCPAFIPSAWAANSAEGVCRLLPSLLQPCSHRIRLQNSLRDLVTHSDHQATFRVSQAIRDWVSGKELARVAVREGKSSDNQQFGSLWEQSPELYTAIQMTLPSLEATILTQRNEISELKAKLRNGTIRGRLSSLSDRVLKSVGIR